jgi:DNA-binding CsgD family transcriptional regulator
MKKSCQNINLEFEIQPWLNGIRLLKPDDRRHYPNDKFLSSISEAFKLPCSVYLLDRESKIQELNEVNVESLRFDSKHELIGKNAFNVFPCESSLKVLNSDKRIMQSRTKNIVEEAVPNGKNKEFDNYLSVKVPWYNQQNEVIGIFGCSINLDEHYIADSLAGITKLGLLNSSVADFASKDRDIKLTRSEINILHHLKNGNTAREIAAIRHTSPRTVEHHIEKIKLKLNVNTRSQLLKIASTLV